MVITQGERKAGEEEKKEKKKNLNAPGMVEAMLWICAELT